MRINQFKPPAVTEERMKALTAVVTRAVTKPALNSVQTPAKDLQYFTPVSVTLKPGSRGLVEFIPPNERRAINALMKVLPLHMELDGGKAASAAFREAIEAALPEGVKLFDLQIDTNAKHFVEIHAALASQAVVSAFASDAQSMITEAVASAKERKARAKSAEVTTENMCHLVAEKDQQTIAGLVQFLKVSRPPEIAYGFEQFTNLAAGKQLDVKETPVVVLSRMLDAVTRWMPGHSWDELVKVPHSEIAGIRERLLAEYPEAALPRDKATFKAYPMSPVVAPYLKKLTEQEQQHAMAAIVARLRSSIDGDRFQSHVGVPREQARAIVEGAQAYSAIPVRELVQKLLMLPAMKDESWWEHTNLAPEQVLPLCRKIQSDKGPEPALPKPEANASVKADGLVTQVEPRDRDVLSQCMAAVLDSRVTPSFTFEQHFKMPRETFEDCLNGNTVASVLTQHELAGAILAYMSEVAVKDYTWTEVMNCTHADVKAALERYRATPG